MNWSVEAAEVSWQKPPSAAAIRPRLAAGDSAGVVSRKEVVDAPVPNESQNHDRTEAF
jgi:hypothetical protein